MLSAQSFKKCRYHLNKPATGYNSLVYMETYKVGQVFHDHSPSAAYKTMKITLKEILPVVSHYSIFTLWELMLSCEFLNLAILLICVAVSLPLVILFIIFHKKTKQKFLSFWVKKTKCQNGTRPHKIPDRI